jgi:hypothetical protein
MTYDVGLVETLMSVVTLLTESASPLNIVSTGLYFIASYLLSLHTYIYMIINNTTKLWLH